MSIDEKRKEQRLTLQIQANCKLEGKIFSAYVWDISQSGLKIELLKKPKKNTAISIILETKPPLKLFGKIRWYKKEGLAYICGIQFENLNEKQSIQLNELTQKLFWENFGG